MKSYQEQIIESVLEARHQEGIEHSPLLVMMDCFAVSRIGRNINLDLDIDYYKYHHANNQKIISTIEELEAILKKYNIKPTP